MEPGSDIILDGSPSTLNQHPVSPSPTEISNTQVSKSPPATPDEDLVAQETEPSIESLLDRLELAERLPPRMFTAVGAIFQQAARDEGIFDPGGTDDWRAALVRADESSRRGFIDIAALGLIRKILYHMWSNGPVEDLVKAAKVLADASREREWLFL